VQVRRRVDRAVADAARAVRATEVIAPGGGTRNPALMARLVVEEGIGTR